MKHSAIAMIVTLLLAGAAGVAVAGLPTDPPSAELRVSEVPMTLEVETSLAVADVGPLTSSTTSTSTTVPATSTIAAPVESAATTNPGGDDSQAVAETSEPETSEPETTEPVTTEGLADELRDRDELILAAANATDGSGVAGAHADVLESEGYVDVTPVDAEAFPTSAVYYQPGFELEAARLATDLGWDPLGLAPMAEIPNLLTERVFELVVLIGLDRA